MLSDHVTHFLKIFEFVTSLEKLHGVTLKLTETGPVALNGANLPDEFKAKLGDLRADIITYLQWQEEAADVFDHELGVHQRDLFRKISKNPIGGS